MWLSPSDLDAYFARLGYRGARTPTLETLAALQHLHTQTFPFENLDVLLGRGISLNLENIFNKFVVARRGGYCFEQNALLLAVLRELGFNVTPLCARVLLQLPPGVRPARTHMLLLVATGAGPHLVDVGFGGLCPTKPLLLEADLEQATRFEILRLLETQGVYLLQAQLDDKWVSLYEFTLEAQTPADYEMANWFSSTHPEARFRNHLVVARAAADRRYGVQNREFVERRAGVVERRPIVDNADLLGILRDYFGIDFPAAVQIPQPQPA